MRAIALCGVLALVGCGDAAAAPRANLQVAALTAARSGGKLDVAMTVRNAGRAAAGTSRTAVIASADRTRDPGDRVLRHVPTRALRRGRRQVLHVSLGAPAGPRWIFACADHRHRVRETSETDNCRRVRVASDRVAPMFGGITMATTCLTAGPPPTTTFDLRWDPATDNRTPPAELVYDIYAATSPDGHDFGRPTYSSTAGAKAFTTPSLPTADTWYFVVRARDAARNRDANYVALEGRNICR